MSSAVAYLVGQLIGATVLAVGLILLKKWRWVPVPYLMLVAIWAVGYWLATHSHN